MKVKIEIDVIEELRRIRDIPDSSGCSCHGDHIEMSRKLDYLISLMKQEESKGYKKAKKAVQRLRSRN